MLAFYQANRLEVTDYNVCNKISDFVAALWSNLFYHKWF